jgi:hypothetical protein
MSRRTAVPIIVCAASLALLVAAGARSEENKETGWTEGDKKAEDKGIEYPGVDPEKMTGIAPLISKAKKSKKTVVTWPGFQMVHGGSRVFVQMLKGTTVDSVKAPTRTKKPPFKVEKNTVVYQFEKKVVLIKNNLNPLITRSFNTPVDYVKVKRKKGRVYMIVKLRVPEEPVREELMSTEDGYHFYFVEFAAGDYLPEDDKEKSGSEG